MIKKWKTLSYKNILNTFVFNYYQSNRESSDGKLKGTFDILECRNWINVFAFDEDGLLLLVEQYRHGIDDTTLEAVAGVVEKDEDPLSAAKRELLEETGHESNTWKHIGRVSANPAFMNNYCDYYIAQDCKKISDQSLDPLEEIDILKMSLSDVKAKIRSGEIHHSLLLAGLGLISLSED